MAEVAQLAEHLVVAQVAVGSSPIFRPRHFNPPQGGFFVMEKTVKPVFLTGYRGSGKSTIGRILSQRIPAAFCDLDQYLCSKANKTVAEIVEKDGWGAFRRLESEVLAEVCQTYGPQTVFATGGGVVLSPANRQHLLNNGTVIWLNVPAEILYARLSRKPDLALRPGFTNASPLEEITTILAQREPLYAASCHHQVEASGNPEAVCTSILKVLGRDQ